MRVGGCLARREPPPEPPRCCAPAPEGAARTPGAARRSLATTRQTHACKAERQSQATAQACQRACSALTLRVSVGEGTIGVHTVLEIAESGPLPFQGSSSPQQSRNGQRPSRRYARSPTYRRKKSQLTLAFFSIARLTLQPVRLAAQQLRLPDDQAARRSTSERCHHHGNHTSGYADNHHYGWRNADPVRRRS